MNFRLLLVLITGCSIFVLQGCLFGDNTEPIPQIKQLELDPAMRFVYRWTLTVDDGGTVTSEKSTFLVTVLDTAARLGNENKLTVMQARELNTPSQNTPVTTTWYRVNQESFTAIAFSRSGSLPSVLPKRTTHFTDPSVLFLPQSVRMQAQNGVDSITPPAVAADTTFRPNPRIVYQFPFLENQRWISFDRPFMQSRKILHREIIEVPAGRFPTFAIDTRSDFFQNSFRWIDHVSIHGLVKREITFTIQRFDDELNALPDRHVRETLELINFQRLLF